MADDHSDSGFIVADRRRFERILDRLADRVRVELGAPGLVGIRRRGAAIVVLRARGIPALPVRADFVGVRLDVNEDSIVEVEVPPYEPGLRVAIRTRPGGARSPARQRASRRSTRRR